MQKNKILFGKDAQEKMFAGIETVYKAVSSTLGGSGKNVVFSRYGTPVVTNDGVSIARKINVEDIFESLGADLIKQAAEKTNEEAGDGTTTATILAYHLISKGKKMLEDNPSLSPIKLKKQLEDALKIALSELDKRAISVKGDDDLYKIAYISSENEEIAKIVTEAVKKAGPNGRVVVEESYNSIAIEKEDIPGMELEGGFISPYMVTHPDRMESVLNNPVILVTDKVFSLNKDLVPILDELNRRGSKELLVVCRNMDSELLATVVTNRIKGLFHCVAVRTNKSKEWLEDLAAFTGSTAVIEEKGEKIITLSHLGNAKRVVVSKDKFLVIRNPQDEYKENIYKERISSLEALINDSTGYEKEELTDRLARLTGSVVVIRSGAPTHAEMVYLKMKIDDAVCSVKAAIKEGYVVGGGLTLYNVGLSVMDGDFGSSLLGLACFEPIKCLIENAGGEFDGDKINSTDGFDTSSGSYVKDLMKLGVIDPVAVEKSSLKNAVSLAGIFLTVGSAIADIPLKEKDGQPSVV